MGFGGIMEYFYTTNFFLKAAILKTCYAIIFQTDITGKGEIFGVGNADAWLSDGLRSNPNFNVIVEDLLRKYGETTILTHHKFPV